MEYSTYQTAIFDFAASSHEPGEIIACAGSGKTFTGVKMCAHFRGEKRGMYRAPAQVAFLAFNKSIQAELEKKLGDTALAKTYHAYGLSAIPNKRLKITQYKNNDLLRAKFGRDLESIFPIISKIVGLYKGDLRSDVSHQTVMDYIDHYGLELSDEDMPFFDEIVEGVDFCLDPDHVERLGKIDFDDMIWYPLVQNYPIPKQDVLLVDECLPYKTPVLLAGGTSKSIGEIVEDRLPVSVLAYDPQTGVQKSCRVVGWSKIPNTKKAVKIKVRWSKRHGTNYPHNFLVCTEDHKLWTEEGYIKAADLRPGIKVQVETSAEKSSSYKITTNGRRVLSHSMTEKNRREGMGNNTKHVWVGKQGGNGRGLTEPQRILLDALGQSWVAEYVVIARKAFQENFGYPSAYKIDIADPERMIAIELDGYSHNSRKRLDEKKDECLRKLGWTVFRFKNKEVLSDLQGIVDRVCVLDCPIQATVVSIEPATIPEWYVYDITVEECHNFYANGILVHNCQDSNLAQMEMVMRADARTIAIGDPHQCQPAGTKVTLTGGQEIDISEITPGMEVTAYDRRSSAFVGIKTQGRKVLKTECRPYYGDLLTIAIEGKETKCTPNHKWVARFNTRSTNVYVTYMMQKGDNFRVGWCQLFDAFKGNHFCQRCRVEGADKAWILSVFDNKADASMEESFIAAFYGLPTIMFKETQATTIYTQERIDQVFKRIGIATMLDHAWRCLGDHNLSLDHPFYVKKDKERRGRSTIFNVDAYNLIPGIMSLPDFEGETQVGWKPITKIEREYVHGLPVYSLEVETHGTYIADGIATHNSIYHWRGAGTKGMEIFAQRTGSTILPLSISYRCPRAVVANINRKYPDIPFEAWDHAIEGSVNTITEDKFYKQVQPGDMVVCRLNAPLVGPAMRLLRQGVKAIIKGRDIGKNLIQLVHQIERKFFPATVQEFVVDLDEYVRKESEKLRATQRFSQADLLEDKMETLWAFADGSDSVAQIKENIERIFADEVAGVVFSSGHKAKGLEADHVYVLHPEMFPFKRARTPEAKAQERNLGYVVDSRAKVSLNYVQG